MKPERLKQLISKHGAKKVMEKIELLKSQRVIENPDGWLIKALENDYPVNQHKGNVFDIKNPPRATSTPEETQAMLAERAKIKRTEKETALAAIKQIKNNKIIDSVNDLLAK